MNTVYAAADAKKITALVWLDISAAFDTIDHDVLASRLESQFGVVGAPPAGYGLISAAVSSSCVLADTRLL